MVWIWKAGQRSKGAYPLPRLDVSWPQRPCSLKAWLSLPSGHSTGVGVASGSLHLPVCHLLPVRGLGDSFLVILIPGYLLQVGKCFGVGSGAGKIGVGSLLLLFLKVNTDILPLLLSPGFPAGPGWDGCELCPGAECRET